MALGPLIPEGAAGAVALSDLFLGLLALLAFIVCYGLLYSWKHTLGALIDALTGLLTIHVLGLHVNFGWPLDKLNNAVQHALSVGVRDSEVAMGRFFHAAGVTVGWMVNFALASATTLEHAVAWLVHVYIPGRASWAASLLFPPALLAKIIRAAIAKELPHIGRVAKDAAHTATTVVYRPVRAFGARLTKAERRLAALAAAVAAMGGVIAHPGHVVSLPKTWRGLTRRLSRLEHRMKRAEGWLAAGALAVALGNVLGVSARCLRSGNVGRAARRICGMDANLLESLLADGLAIVGALSVVEFAHELRAIEDEAVKILGAAIKEWPS